MDVLWVIGGLALVAAALIDAVWTVLWPEGRGGPLSSNVSRTAWHTMERAGGGRDRLLSLAGPVVLVLTVLLWVTLLAAGWTLVFTPEEALRSTRDETEDLAGRIWFVVYTMHTVGNGDFTPTTNWSEIAASFTAFTGMVVITLAVTYLLSVIRAVARRRSFASHASALGESAEDMVVNAWDGNGFPGLDSILDTLSSTLGEIEHDRRAFPSVQYFHPATASRSSEAMLGMLDDALTLWADGVTETARPTAAGVRVVRASVRSYLQILHDGSIDPSDDTPPPPDLDRLRAAGIPTVDDPTFAGRLRALADHRRLLLAVSRSDNWDWGSPAD